MPINNTLALDFLLEVMRKSKFSRMDFNDKPRSPSFAPSSMMTMAGLCSLSSSGNRRFPPWLVSPDILALISLY